MGSCSHQRLTARGLLGVALLGTSVAIGGAALAQPLCPDMATLSVYVENPGAAPSVDVDVDGELAGNPGCVGTGSPTYRSSMRCSGSGLVRCGEIPGLQPGAWIHRVGVSVPGSDRQRQARRSVLVAGDRSQASNPLVWTVYPRTFEVSTCSPDAEGGLRQQLQAAADAGGPALVTFASGAFPCTIHLASAPCVPDPLRHAALCFEGSQVVVDALDPNGSSGAVTWSVDARDASVLRVYGSDNVFRGLVFEGSTRATEPGTPCQLDTVAITGANARRNRIEQSIVVGPSCGDAVSVDQLVPGSTTAECPAGEEHDEDNVVAESRITGAHDRGVKLDYCGFATIERSCIHDNRNGGLLSTGGSEAIARENIVQHNVLGHSQNGLSVGGGQVESKLATNGNIVRFSGQLGLSVVDKAVAQFDNDYVSDSQLGGMTVRTTDGPASGMPTVQVHGMAFVCNRHDGLTGTCAFPTTHEDVACTSDEDCCIRPDDTVDPACMATCQPAPLSRGLGSVVQAPCTCTATTDGGPSCASANECCTECNASGGGIAGACMAAACSAPAVNFGDAIRAGRNAFTANKNTSCGANFRVKNVHAPVPAIGNQWEHCGTGAMCDVTSVADKDVSACPGAAMVDIGEPRGPRAEAPLLSRISPARPQAGDVVRIFGENFNAIEGNPAGGTGACAELRRCSTDEPCPTGPCVNGTCACSIENPAVQAANQQTNANRIRIKDGDGTVLSDAMGRHDFWPDAVTPTMLAFRMPFDCFAPLLLEVAKRDPSGNRVSATIPLCDPQGCADAPEGTSCGDACHANDVCNGQGKCVPGRPVVCAEPCLRCDPAVGCVPRATSARCDDGDACTSGDHCSGDGNVCVPGRPVVCEAPCLTGDCDHQRGCVPKPAGTVCREAAGPCDVDETCNGTMGDCPPDAFRTAGTMCRASSGICDPAEVCSGMDAACPSDAKSSAVCRPAAGECDAAESCDGVHDDCPPDVQWAAGTVCRPAAGPCDVDEICPGSSTACPRDEFKASTVVCREASDSCKLPDHCTGSSAACPQADEQRTGCAALSCRFERTIALPDCSQDAVPDRVARLFYHASDIVHRSCPPWPRRHACASASAALRKALESLDRASGRRRHPISAACSRAVGGVLRAARDGLGCSALAGRQMAR